MNDQMSTPTPASVMNGAPDWLTLPFVLIAIGIVCALLILFWGARQARKRRHAQVELEDRGEAHYATDALRAPPVAPSPPPLADAPVPAVAPIVEEPIPEALPFADEPIAAAAPMDASPASVATDLAHPEPAGAASGDDLTRMKGVGPKLAAQLNQAGITRFEEIAALSPAEADALDKRLGTFQGRIHRDRWIEQARFLASGDTAGYEATFGRL
jgi:predicted flap endonuclease-1-like 5' DNA nuclease